jgi:hypothetical protein
LNFILNQSSCVSQGCNNKNKAQFMSYLCLFFSNELVCRLTFHFFGFMVFFYLGLCMVILNVSNHRLCVL